MKRIVDSTLIPRSACGASNATSHATNSTCFQHDSDSEVAFQRFQLTCPKRRRLFFQRKYLVDRCLGGALLVLATPLILVIYAIVRIASPGPGFYRQERLGLHGESFYIVKIRSMKVDAEQPGKPQWCTKGDPRVTRLGRVLRKLHLDELPQLLNVFRGEMSLVGPRPERPKICSDLAEKIDGYYHRTVVKPGVTGLAQINLPPDETVDDVRRKQILDLHYIENAGLWLDARMMFATALRLVGLSGASVMKLMRLDRTHLVQQLRRADGTDHVLPSSVVGPWEADRSFGRLEPEMAFSMAGGQDVYSSPSSSPSSSSPKPR